jgi:phosphopantetheinyl transferase (holo-ACP synthase)
MTVLFSILFQSLHTYEHFAKQFAEKECHQKEYYGEPEITHQHHL